MKAHSVMQPVAEYRALHADCRASTRCRTTSPEADIDELIDLTMQSDRDAVAVVENGAIIGVVTTRGLLRGVAGTSAATVDVGVEGKWHGHLGHNRYFR